jgi:hypothetical protein
MTLGCANDLGNSSHPDNRSVHADGFPDMSRLTAPARSKFHTCKVQGCEVLGLLGASADSDTLIIVVLRLR